jgi:glycosyltransferase involved in cell wall biosynthesis
MTLKIAVLVHGRFHAFDLTRELLNRGHDVTLFTNYPQFAAGRFGIPPRRVRSHLAHGIGSRALWRLFPGGLGGNVERLTNTTFGRWAARQVRRPGWDVVVAFSGIAKEAFEAVGDRSLKVLQRGSSHIRSQWELLQAEEARAGRPVEKPSPWIIAREEREYQLADAIHVLSEFAHRSFVAQGVSPEKLYQLYLGVNTQVFAATDAVIEERCRRILAGEPLRVLNVSTFCCRKGAVDFAEVVRRLGTQRFAFRFVGPIAWDAQGIKDSMAGAEFVGKRPQNELPREYQWGDVFVLPTVEDGFAVVLTQALASGLPLLTTSNCSGPDLIHEGETGWVVPIRCPEAIVEQLLWCDRHRVELAEVVRRVHRTFRPHDWSETGRQAEGNILRALARRAEREADRRAAPVVDMT